MDEIIDLGQWNCPKDWNDITLEKYQQIEKYYSGKEEKFDIRDVIHILCDKTIDDVNALPMEFLEEIMQHMDFLTKPPHVDDATNKIEIDGVVYTVNTQNKMKAGEFIATETIMKDDPNNTAALLAILCRKEGEQYDSHFENEVLEDRIKMFEKTPITKVLPVISFFLQLYMIYAAPIQLSTMLKEGIKESRQNIRSSQKNGLLSKLYTKWQMRKLKKLEKSINSILQTTYNLSHI